MIKSEENMIYSEERIRRLEEDIRLGEVFRKGVDKPVMNCWHFYTDGNSVDTMFCDEEDFRKGMNRIFTTICDFEVIILAFTLMDTHLHFILNGRLKECAGFIHEYVRRTSHFISRRHNERKKMETLRISHQEIDSDSYLKTAVCYVLKNAPSGGLPFNAIDYPWSSGPLMFRRSSYWSSPGWTYDGNLSFLAEMPCREQRKILSTHTIPDFSVRMTGDIVFPGEYVPHKTVEKVFGSHKSFNYFMSRTKESDVESWNGEISHLQIPMQEMRQHRNELSLEMFGTEDIRTLDTGDRIRLARSLKSRYDSSPKQIARLCRLVFEEVKGKI